MFWERSDIWIALKLLRSQVWGCTERLSGDLGEWPCIYLFMSCKLDQFVALKWASHHIHVLASPERSAAASGGGEPETNSIHTLAHTEAGLSAATDKCTTLSHYSPINICAVSANSRAARQIARSPQTFPLPSEDTKGIPHQFANSLTIGKAMAHISDYRNPNLSAGWRKKKSDIYLTGENLLAAFECIARLARYTSRRTVS